MDNGFNIVDFMDLPNFERCVVRLILRESEVTYPQLVEAITALPDFDHMVVPVGKGLSLAYKA